MTQTNQAVIQEAFNASNRGAIHFGEVIGILSGAQVESYHVDYRSGRTTYYLQDGRALDFSFEKPVELITASFDFEAIRAAILSAQQRLVMYPEFVRLTKFAGCVGYTVWIAGRYVSYFGRNGQTHIEHFPE